MRQIEAGTIDLVFADPPFNIGYEYDEYHDRQDDEEYLAWVGQWMDEVHRILSRAARSGWRSATSTRPS